MFTEFQLHRLFSSPADGAQGTPGGQGAGQPAGQATGQEPGQPAGQPAAAPAPIEDLWKAYSPDVSKASRETLGEYFSNKIDNNETALRMIAADKQKAADLFYGFTDLFAGNPTYVNYLISRHPEAVKMIAQAAGYVPQGTAPPGAVAPGAIAPSPDYGALPEDENMIRMQAKITELEQKVATNQATQEQLDAVIERDSVRMYQEGESRLDGDLDAYVAQKLTELVPGIRPEAIKLAQSSIKGGKVSDAQIKNLYFRTLSNRFGSNTISATQDFENLKRVVDAHISGVVPVFGGSILEKSAALHTAANAGQLRISPNGGAMPPTTEVPQNGRIDLAKNAVERYERSRGIR